MSNWSKESKIEKVMIDWIKSQGFSLNPITSKRYGVDIEAMHKRRRRYWFIEVKGWPTAKKSAPAQRHIWFITALGQIIKRMRQKNGKYGVAFPDYEYYEKQVLTLPAEARKRLNVNFFLVSKKKEIRLLTPRGKRFKVIQ